MIKSQRWFVVALLFLAGVINYLDRSALSIAAPLIQKDLNFSHAQMGVVFSSFFVGYALFNFVGGVLSDKVGAKRVFGTAMGVWSLFCGATALATGIGSLIVLRVLFGMGEGPFSSSNSKMVNNWFPRKEVASAIGVISSGTPLGGALAGPVVGFMAVQFGWRWAFVAIMLLGLLWLVFWAATTTEHPQQNSRVTSDEMQLILAGQADEHALAHSADGSKLGLGHFLRKPIILATAFAFFSYNYVLFFFLSWFPTYLTEAHHLSLHDMSIATVIPWVLGSIGLAAGGFISDLILRLTGKPLLSRKIVLGTCLGAAAVCVALAGRVASTESAVALMSVSIFFLYVTGAVYWAVIQDTVPREHVGGVGGFVHLLANLAGVIGPAVTGFIVQATHGAYGSAFVLAGGIAVLGAVCSLVWIREPRASTLAVERAW
ncbi:MULTISPECIES: MFS transporter [Paraburkholderia]|jgi:D-galactonate transporter|uniref:D-galactonate transporter n=2 Tax=Burkholderiaceae TaxID=119060 RepID=A0AB73IC77_9BURK|nr:MULTISPECIES: MFS transporter [Paraburkholderia]MDP9647633.1 D-galactonate transporter [Paraburkholderia caledonica]MDR6375809.1 D-galactonate transporter [Paraburkholderia caledonica]MDR7003901.1 D-galactonate transporter [Paraburkholderia strydomiana]TCG00286.1 MFS transporter [Paraburkholderia strydomiana]